MKNNGFKNSKEAEEYIVSQKKECRLCSSEIQEIVNLGNSSPANNFVKAKDDLSFSYPLILDYCKNCFCLQLRHCLDHEILYKDYTYMTPDVDFLNSHCSYLIDLLNSKNVCGKEKQCLELGSNVGLFIKIISPEFRRVIGIDPAENIAKIANDSGYETICDFFSPQSSKTILEQHGLFDLIVARHMFAHNVDPNILLESMNNVLTSDGTILIENAYAIPTLINGEFDQVYHEHMFYYSVANMQKLLKNNGFELYDLTYSEIHGGTIAFLCSRIGKKEISPKINDRIEEELVYFKDMKIFKDFNRKILEIRDKVIKEISKDIDQKKEIIAYGATAKAFTMFSFLDIDSSVINYCVDTSVTKIGKYFPGLGIRVIEEKDLENMEFDTVLVTAWNYKKHIIDKSNEIFPKGTKLIFPLPEFDIHIV